MADMIPTLCGKRSVYVPESGCNDCTILEERVETLETATASNTECCAQNTQAIQDITEDVSSLIDTASCAEVTTLIGTIFEEGVL